MFRWDESLGKRVINGPYGQYSLSNGPSANIIRFASSISHESMVSILDVGLAYSALKCLVFNE